MSKTLFRLDRRRPLGPKANANIIAAWIALGVTFLPLSAIKAEDSSPQYFVANTTPPDAYLSLRTDPSSNFGRRIATLPNGSTFQVLERRSDGWWRVHTSAGLEGWLLSAQGNKTWVACCMSATADVVPQTPAASPAPITPASPSDPLISPTPRPIAPTPVATVSTPKAGSNEALQTVTTPRTPSGFDTFEQLIRLPTACLALQDFGTAPNWPKYWSTEVQDPLTGRYTPSSTCKLVTECVADFPSRLGPIVEYLRTRPLLYRALRLQPVRSGDVDADAAIRSFSSNVDTSMNDCVSFTMTIDQYVMRIDPHISGRAPFESFAELSRNLMSELRTAHAAKIAAYREWLPYAPHYARADELGRLSDRYEVAFNGPDIEAFLALKPEFEKEMSAAAEFKAILLQQTDELASLVDRLADMSHWVSQEPLSKIVEPNVAEAIDKLKAELEQLRGLPAAERGDASDQIKRSEAAIGEFEGDIKAARAKLDDLTRMEAKRQAAVGAATEALAVLSKPGVETRLNESRIGLPKQIQTIRGGLTMLTRVPLWERQDYSGSLDSMKVALGQVEEIRQNLIALDSYTERVDKLNVEIDRRNRRYLDADASKAVSELGRDLSALDESPLPLSDADTQKLSRDSEKVGDLQSRLPAIMDGQERALLAGKFPLTYNKWSLEFKIDKLTDAQSVEATTFVDGDQAKYRIDVSCKKGGWTLEIAAFEKDSEKGKAVAWSEAGAKLIRLRTDSNPAYDAFLISNGYVNDGLVSVPFDPQSKLTSSDRLVFGDVFPDDQVEVETNFPSDFQRLCDLIVSQRSN